MPPRWHCSDPCDFHKMASGHSKGTRDFQKILQKGRFLLAEGLLHIFEPRYLQLVTECLSSGEYFGIPYQGKTTLSEFGSLVKVVQILKNYDSGELDVLVECRSNFKIHHFGEGSKYSLFLN